MDITGYAAISGAGSGIGRATAMTFAREGAAGIAMLDISGPALERARRDVEGAATNPAFRGVLTFEVDVRDEAGVDSAIASTHQKFGRIDYLVNCAGIAFKHRGTAAAETKDWQRVLDINLTGTFFALRACARIMLQQDPIKSAIDGRPLQRGSIVNISSVLGHVGVTNSVAYCASKHGVIGLTKNASEDHAAQGLRINAVCPGFIETPLTASTPEIIQTFKDKTEVWTPMKRPGQPQEIADVCVWLAGGRSSFVTGTSICADGGYLAR
ncbi:3-oxoacyl-[acyl-carrier protein] reductase [Fonsecaea erecta]|uniref:3-oxoacyl-[acyl-carrier protein] reductase n=1 Tax=Fonsecaea erecta TaxID=1367422 RepID=A0A178ZJ37_9EURO|nr:3-oxoacyl-[acyl-carrier protein] reductase [Fonsecaea erecta]OAP59203.1 3-oxoacyl-[acyl-carrier protein] reductase [Fonsecaea erecta]